MESNFKTVYNSVNIEVSLYNIYLINIQETNKQKTITKNYLQQKLVRHLKILHRVGCI